ncbi:response regulator transcription factor [Paracoccus aestuariivivens]|uniref:Response regulator n=1 Tax=Paracoccus aestuariivivens TaxID=1820333 RepID=A0A6L6JJD6_9RHOB|nr:response regulator transcription factor [Paracoccus aestuariivivens]MTH80264.1 response regulator [Paracoccus aestuariivivens]
MTTNDTKILIVDDEQPIRKFLRVGLAAEGFATIEARNAREAGELLTAEKPDIVLLDLGLPDRSGHEVLESWRAALIKTPVVILSSRTDEAGIVKALEMGADDYMTKPFSMRELAARLRVSLRHRLARQGEKPLFQTGDLTVDLVRRIVRVAGEEVKLSPKEYDLLRILVSHAGKVITHQHLLRAAD